MFLEAMLFAPAAILLADGKWSDEGTGVARFSVAAGGATCEIDIIVGETGRPKALRGRVVAADGRSSGALTATPSDFRATDGHTVPHHVTFSEEREVPPLLATFRLDDIRYAGPWIGSSHS
jgi:hypothetical protein